MLGVLFCDQVKPLSSLWFSFTLLVFWHVLRPPSSGRRGAELTNKQESLERPSLRFPRQTWVYNAVILLESSAWVLQPYSQPLFSSVIERSVSGCDDMSSAINFSHSSKGCNTKSSSAAFVWSCFLPASPLFALPASLRPNPLMTENIAHCHCNGGELTFPFLPSVIRLTVKPHDAYLYSLNLSCQQFFLQGRRSVKMEVFMYNE